MRIFEYYDTSIFIDERNVMSWHEIKKIINNNGYLEIVEPTYQDMYEVIIPEETIVLYSNDIHVSFTKKDGFNRNDLLLCILETEHSSNKLADITYNNTDGKIVYFGYLEKYGENNVYKVVWEI